MSALLDLAIEAHGGWARWREVETVTTRIALGGAIWDVKGWPGVFADARARIDTRRQHAEYAPFVEPDRHTLYEPDRTAIVADSSEVVGERRSPRAAFAGHTLGTRWDAHHLIYFTGYALWTYLTTPFLLKLRGVVSEEIEPWDEDGETWRRLKVTFPPGIHTHSTEQVFYFGPDGLLRRQDYSVEIMGGTSSANYALAPVAVGGLVLPTRRRVHPIGPGNRPNRDRLSVAVDFRDIEIG